MESPPQDSLRSSFPSTYDAQHVEPSLGQGVHPILAQRVSLGGGYLCLLYFTGDDILIMIPHAAGGGPKRPPEILLPLGVCPGG
jgi:hypothetical protein